MKKIIIGILVLCSLLALCACVENETAESSVTEASSQSAVSEAVSNASSEAEVSKKFEVTVVDGDGNKVSGVMLQVCKDACMPAKTDENGVATFNIEITDGYKLSVMTCPEGYKYEGDAEIYLESGITEYTLTIEKDAE